MIFDIPEICAHVFSRLWFPVCAVFHGYHDCQYLFQVRPLQIIFLIIAFPLVIFSQNAALFVRCLSASSGHYFIHFYFLNGICLNKSTKSLRYFKSICSDITDLSNHHEEVCLLIHVFIFVLRYFSY